MRCLLLRCRIRSLADSFCDIACRILIARVWGIPGLRRDDGCADELPRRPDPLLLALRHQVYPIWPLVRGARRAHRHWDRVAYAHVWLFLVCLGHAILEPAGDREQVCAGQWDCAGGKETGCGGNRRSGFRMKGLFTMPLL